MSGVVKTAVSMVVGSFMDRLGARKCMLAAIVMAIPTVVAFTLARSFDQTLVVYISLVVSNAFLWIASNVLLADTILRATRGRVMAPLGQGIGVGISGGGYAHGFLLFIPATIGSFVGGVHLRVEPLPTVAHPGDRPSPCLRLREGAREAGGLIRKSYYGAPVQMRGR